MTQSTLPRRIRIQEILSGRYAPGKRPLSWDARKPGVEKVRTADGEVLSLYSNGGQSTPAPGWQLLLTKPHASATAEEAGALQWTLYGVAEQK